MKDVNGDERYGDWMQVGSRQFWPLDPRPEEIRVEDVARGLAMKCRYGGHVTKFYSVAEHSVYVSQNVPREFARQALLHDASEAYLGDMIRPLKTQPEFRAFRAVEDKLEALIYARFGVTLTDASCVAVKDADNRILIDERQVRRALPAPWHGLDGLSPLGIRIAGYAPAPAEAMFLSRFYALFPEFSCPGAE